MPNNTSNPQNSVWKRLTSFFGLKKNPKKVYFVSGMCNSCSVYDRLKLPDGYEKVYIEWLIPQENETMDSYVHRMAQNIDTSEPFILVGYSFGGIIIQEMNAFLSPQKNILISSMKNENEIPQSFKFARQVHFFKHVPKSIFGATDFMTSLFSRYIYSLPKDRVRHLMAITDPLYVRWAVDKITSWTPRIKCNNLYHIHGTKDQIFPFRQIENVYGIAGGDHLMVMDKAEEITVLINHILLEK